MLQIFLGRCEEICRLQDYLFYLFIFFLCIHRRCSVFMHFKRELSFYQTARFRKGKGKVLEMEKVSIPAVVDGHYSSPKPINNCVLQGSVLSPTLFLLFINDLSVTKCNIHSYADDSTLYFSTSFERKPTLHYLQDSRLEATERLTSDLALISDWDRRNLVSFNASKTQFLHLSI